MSAARFLASLIALFSLATGPVYAAIHTYLLIPGVPGESVADRHEGWIDVEALSVGVTAGVCDGFTLQKRLDKASPLLSAAALFRTVYPTATIEAVKDGIGFQRFLIYSLESVSVYSVAVKHTADSVTEVVTLRPATITITYYPQRPDGSLDAAITSVVPCKYR